MGRFIERAGAAAAPFRAMGLGLALLLVLMASVATPRPAWAADGPLSVQVESLTPFDVEFSSEDLTTLLRSRLDFSGVVSDPSATITPSGVLISGWLNWWVSLPFAGEVGLHVEDGAVRLDLRSVSVGFLSLSGDGVRDLEDRLNRALDLDGSLRRAGMTAAREVILGEGTIRVIGTQQPSGFISQATLDWLVRALAQTEGHVAPYPPGADVVPVGAVASKDGADLYLALGDSLAAGVGAGRAEEGYVPRFHAYLERRTGHELGLHNLAIPGETTASMFSSGQLDRALAEMRSRRDDGDPATRVSAVTLDIGGNDLLRALDSSVCVFDPSSAGCQARVDAALAAFDAGIARVLAAVAGELEPGAELYVMTAYNPFDLDTGTVFEALTRQVTERMNAIIRACAAQVGARVADPYAAMRGNTATWTHILHGDIHPNAEGHQALAYALAVAREAS